MATTTRRKEKTVQILARSVVYRVRNPEGHIYIVTLHNDGRYACTQANGEPCPSREFGRKCYHVKAVERAERRDEPEQTTQHELSVDFAYGSCGHLVRPEYAGLPCGACMW